MTTAQCRLYEVNTVYILNTKCIIYCTSECIGVYARVIPFLLSSLFLPLLLFLFLFLPLLLFLFLFLPLLLILFLFLPLLLFLFLLLFLLPLFLFLPLLLFFFSPFPSPSWIQSLQKSISRNGESTQFSLLTSLCYQFSIISQDIFVIRAFLTC